MKILSQYDNWYSDCNNPDNDNAKMALQEFYKNLKRCKTDKVYKASYNTDMHVSYLHKLLAIREALKEYNYLRACNEVTALLYYEPFLQKRIYYNLIDLLEKFMGDIKNVIQKEEINRNSYTS